MRNRTLLFIRRDPEKKFFFGGGADSGGKSPITKASRIEMPKASRGIIVWGRDRFTDVVS